MQKARQRYQGTLNACVDKAWIAHINPQPRVLLYTADSIPEYGLARQLPMKANFLVYSFTPFFCAVLLTACQSPSRPGPTQAINPAAQKAAQAALDQGSRQYEAGNFAAAIKVLSGASEINLARTDTQVEAHKLLAFSYCSSGKPSFCHAEFVKILSLDPGFKLSESERHHPIWGPVFESARKQANL